jgi:D-3-phosphoglycerate dehydrogenase
MMLKSGPTERKVRGTVLHGNTPRLLRIDDIDVEAPLEGNVIYLLNRDVPGVVGRVGTVLGQHNINIGNFSLGRSPEAHEPRTAVAVIQVDNEITEAALSDLRRIDAIEVAEAIRFTETPEMKAAGRNAVTV